ncbi:efflux RND transporter periplasmic adaptor subunit [Pontibacter sp. SGAir0037]|uniref:efflux RND transporter periplasmic adaptor subunit n=1 Tax=Pontibacter sp. SGAir0037 TaxID=2571030 RepID=UPI0010CD0EDE|nr:efflux RND transporter periplasmic adaptor subunit [Pontibacter sp. SGAir0037]QCR23812.1 efflux RND transporter periplasmic adaptor subunit [Pontibacter sp. SGAir0037]
MKRVLGISFAAAITLLAACTNNPDKAAQLEALKKEQAELQTQIAQLEAELKAEGKGEQAQQKTVPVSVTAVTQEPFKHFLEVQGRVDFDQSAFVSARVPGVLTSVRVQRGDKVSKGQVMATIDAMLVEQNIQELRTRLELAKVAYEKQKNLWDQKIGTEMQYLTAKNNYESLQRNLATLQEQRNQYNIIAPINGVVDEVVPNAGEAVSPGVGIVRVVNTAGGKVVAEVSEAYLSKIKKGDEAVVYFPDLQQEATATVQVVSQYINPTSRTFIIELKLQNLGREVVLRPNLVSVVRIQDYKNETAISVPVNLVQKDEKSQFVYVAKKEGNGYIATRQEVDTGVSYDGRVEVLKGLSASDQVITAGYQNLNEGQPVVFSQVSSLNQ